MILPVVKLGTLALRTICKHIASRLKKEAGLHPKFRQSINLEQAIKRKNEDLEREIDVLKHKLHELQHTTKG